MDLILDYKIYLTMNVPDEDYYRNVPDEGYYRNVSDEGY